MSFVTASLALFLFAFSITSARPAFANGAEDADEDDEIHAHHAEELHQEYKGLSPELAKTATDLGLCIVASRTHGIAGILDQVSTPGMTREDKVEAVMRYAALQGIASIKRNIKGHAVKAGVKLIPVFGQVVAGYSIAQRAKRFFTCRKIVALVHEGNFANLTSDQCGRLVKSVEQERRLNESLLSKYYRWRISPVMKYNCEQFAGAYEVMSRL